LSELKSHAKNLCLTGLFCLSFFGANPVFASNYSEAVDLFAKKEYQKAAALFQKAQAAGENAANATYYEALCYHYGKDLERAKIIYQQVIRKYPQSEASRNSLKVLIKIDPVIAKKYAEAMDGIAVQQEQDYLKLPQEASVKFFRTNIAKGHLVVPTTVNGVPAQMIFDTGASSTHVTERWLALLGVKPKYTKYTGRAMGVGGEVNYRVALLTIRVGELERTIPVSVQEGSGALGDASNNPLTEMPLLGQTFYKDFIYEIDDNGQKISFKKLASRPNEKTDKTQARAKSRQRLADNEVPFYYEGNSIIVTAKINGRECEMIFDTGAGSVAFADRHLAACGINRPVESFQGQGGGVGGKRDAYMFTLDSVKLGSVEKKNVTCHVLMNTPFPKPLLGQTFLEGLKYTIDPGRKVIIFN